MKLPIIPEEERDIFWFLMGANVMAELILEKMEDSNVKLEDFETILIETLSFKEEEEEGEI
jgi:hypothetical protein